MPWRISCGNQIRATSMNGRAENIPILAAGADSDIVNVVHCETPRLDRSTAGRGVRNGSSKLSSSGRSVRSIRAAAITPSRQYAASPSKLASDVVGSPRSNSFVRAHSTSA